ncbi:lysine histidine transporter 1 [Artemisia annua]|uniref:Lysine histidine transporter 1 n=1 Tax=Artemisia annua TaxID=35608 RepID=A0A2U1P887_ARTAN|nr:lysine histidine transporter 1 [Artemisia annua]
MVSDNTMATQDQQYYGENKVDNRSEKEKAIDAWLPITSSRNAKWWYSAFHNVTAMVGAGVLSLPYAMSELGCYQIYAMPFFDMIETVLVKKLNFTPSFMLRFVTRNIYVATTMFLGICFPFFGGLLGFFGGFAFAPTTYFLPCVMWLSIHKPKRWSLSWICNWICIFFGVALMVLSPIGGLRSIIVQAKDYKFFS